MTTLHSSLETPTSRSPHTAAAWRLTAFSCRAFLPSLLSSSLPCYTPKTSQTPPEALFVVCYFKGKEAKDRAFPQFCAGFCQCRTFSVSKHPHVKKSLLSSFHVSLPRPEHGPLLSQPKRYPGPLSISCSASGVGSFSSQALFLCRGGSSLHTPQYSPAKPLPVYLFRIMFSWKRWVVTLLYFLAKRKQVHFISIERTLKGCHLERKHRKQFRTAKDLTALHTADGQR